MDGAWRSGHTLYLIRHGQCLHNMRGLIAAQNDSPLTPLGCEQARANGKLLTQITGDPATLGFFASPLHRACATMELLREAAGLEPSGYFADRRLMEIDFGDHSWKTWDEIAFLAMRGMTKACGKNGGRTAKALQIWRRDWRHSCASWTAMA